MLLGNLRQKQPPSSIQSDQQSMMARFHLFRGDRSRHRQDAQLNPQMRRFLQGDRGKSNIFKGRGPRRLCHGSIDRSHGQRIADASSQLALQIKKRR